MAKSGKKSLLDFFKVTEVDEDEFDDDLFEEDEDDDYEYTPKSTVSSNNKYSKESAYNMTNRNFSSQYQRPVSTQNDYSQNNQDKVRNIKNQPNRVVSMNSSRANKGGSEVYVIRPREFDDAQAVADSLKAGRAIVINMEGVELAPAQRIIDFIGGACYALNGSIQAISGNIFIAAPDSVEVSGDLREEILSDSLPPQLGQF